MIAHHSLEHIADHHAALRGFARVLRPGGLALPSLRQNHSVEHTDEDPSVTEPTLRG